jgi:outer membrane protein OmpA-like peptidoglycan-associated protein
MRGNTLMGATGLLRLMAADSGPVGGFRVSLIEGLYSGKGFLCPDCARSNGSVSTSEDRASLSSTRLALSVTPASFLEGFASVNFQSVSNDQNSPRVLQTGGSADVGAKTMMPYRKGRFWSLAGLADLSLLAKNRSIGHAAVNFELAALGTVDFRELTQSSQLPLRVILNANYRFDNSGDIADDIESRRREQRGRPQRVTRIERLGFAIRRTDVLRLGLGAEGAFERYRPFAEWSIDVPVNRQGYECKLGLVSSGDSCLSHSREFSAMASRLSLGLRAMPFSRRVLDGLGLLLAVDVGTGGTGSFVEESIPELPWMAHLGLFYTVEATSHVVTVVEFKEKPTVVAAPEPPETFVSGRIVEKLGNDSAVMPVAQAMVFFKDGDKQGIIADLDGRFRTSELPPGHHVFRVTKGGFNDAECATDVLVPTSKVIAQSGSDGVRAKLATDMVCELVRLPTTAVVSGVLRDAETTLFVPNASVNVFDARGRKLSLKTDEFGGFRVEKVPEGSVRFHVEVDGYLAGITELQVKARENTTVQLSVFKRPKQSNVTVTAKELKLKRQLHFLHDSSEMLPDSLSLLEELADALRTHPEIGLVEIQGHTDDSGSAEHNVTLSRSRANAVRDALIGQGVDAERLVAKGYGASQPLVPNTNNANRSKNRRVQLLVQKQ